MPARLLSKLQLRPDFQFMRPSLASEIGSYDKFLLVIPRAEVEGREESRTGAFLCSLAATPESICEYFDQVILVFEGYDGDARELWMIPEVCTFVERTNSAFAGWGFFLSTYSLSTIAKCLVGSEAHASLPAPYVFELLELVVESMFVTIGTLSRTAGFSDDQLRGRLQDVAEAVLGVELRL